MKTLNNENTSPISLLDIVTMRSEHIHNLYDRKRTMNQYLKLDKNTPKEKISILLDAMFKAMLFQENRIKYSCKLLSYYLNIPFEELLKNLKLGKNELDKRKENSKGERADYVAYYKDICINIELNCNNSIERLERNREYRHRLQDKKIKRGEKYNYTPVLQININNFTFEGKEKTKYIYYLMDEEGDVESDKEIVIHIYVPNIYKKWYTSGVDSLSEDERFLLTLVEPNIKKAEELGKDCEIMEEYIHEAIEVSSDVDLLDIYDNEWAIRDQSIRDTKGEIVEKMSSKYGISTIMEITGLSRKEVLEYGGDNLKEDDVEDEDKEKAIKEQSIRDTKEDIVKNMLKKNLDMKLIMEITGLSRKEVLEYGNETTETL